MDKFLIIVGIMSMIIDIVIIAVWLVILSFFIEAIIIILNIICSI